MLVPIEVAKRFVVERQLLAGGSLEPEDELVAQLEGAHRRQSRLQLFGCDVLLAHGLDKPVDRVREIGRRAVVTSRGGREAVVVFGEQPTDEPPSRALGDDVELGRVAQVVGVLADEPVTEGVVGVDVDRRRRVWLESLGDRRADACGGLIRKGQHEYVVGIDITPLDGALDPDEHRRRLPGAGPASTEVQAARLSMTASWLPLGSRAAADARSERFAVSRSSSVGPAPDRGSVLHRRPAVIRYPSKRTSAAMYS